MAIIAITAISSCRRASNRYIDGYWRIKTVELKEDGTTFTPENKFIRIYLELMQLATEAENGKNSFTGIMSYDKKARTIGVEFPYESTASSLNQFGVYENPVTFTILKASGGKLVLETPESIITCQRF